MQIYLHILLHFERGHALYFDPVNAILPSQSCGYLPATIYLHSSLGFLAVTIV